MQEPETGFRFRFYRRTHAHLYAQQSTCMELDIMKVSLTPGTVARRLNLSTSRVIQLDREGVLQALRDSGNRRYYDPETVERFAQARERRRAAEEGRAAAPRWR